MIVIGVSSSFVVGLIQSHMRRKFVFFVPPCGVSFGQIRHSDTLDCAAFCRIPDFSDPIFDHGFEASWTWFRITQDRDSSGNRHPDDPDVQLGKLFGEIVYASEIGQTYRVRQSRHDMTRPSGCWFACDSGWFRQWLALFRAREHIHACCTWRCYTRWRLRDQPTSAGRYWAWWMLSVYMYTTLQSQFLARPVLFVRCKNMLKLNALPVCCQTIRTEINTRREVSSLSVGQTWAKRQWWSIAWFCKLIFEILSFILITFNNHRHVKAWRWK